MKTLDQAVIELNGVLPHKILTPLHAAGVGAIINYFGKIKICGDELDICTEQEFQQRAKELGFINGYRWGVEHKTDGKRPDLPDDVVVEMQYADGRWHKDGADELGEFFLSSFSAFKITDQRYKPADTSYLEKPALEHVPEEESWYDYDSQEMRTLPSSNEDVELLMGGVYRCRVEYIGIRGFKVVFYRYDNFEIDNAELPTASFRPLDHDRKAKDARAQVVDAALKEFLEFSGNAFESLNHLYDKGFLKLPE